MNVPQGLPQEIVTDVTFLYTRFVRLNDNLVHWHSIPRDMKIRAIEASLVDFGTAYNCFQDSLDALATIDSVIDKKANPTAVVRRELFQYYCRIWRRTAEVLMGDGLLASLVDRMKEVVELNPPIEGVITLRRVKEKIQIQEMLSETQKLEAQRILGSLKSFSIPKDVGLTTKGHMQLMAMLRIAKDFEVCIKALHRRIKEYCDDYAEPLVPKPLPPLPEDATQESETDDPAQDADIDNAVKDSSKDEAWWNIGQAK